MTHVFSNCKKIKKFIMVWPYGSVTPAIDLENRLLILESFMQR